jgi:hypothetical protein
MTRINSNRPPVAPPKPGRKEKERTQARKELVHDLRTEYLRKRSALSTPRAPTAPASRRPWR